MSGIRDIAKGAGVKTEDVVDIFEEILRRVRKDERVKVAGFGSFGKKSFPGRTLTSPVINDGIPVKFETSFRIGFNCSSQAKKRLNMKRKKKAPAKKILKKKPVKKKPTKGKEKK